MSFTQYRKNRIAFFLKRAGHCQQLLLHMQLTRKRPVFVLAHPTRPSCPQPERPSDSLRVSRVWILFRSVEKAEMNDSCELILTLIPMIHDWVWLGKKSLCRRIFFNHGNAKPFCWLAQKPVWPCALDNDQVFWKWHNLGRNPAFLGSPFTPGAIYWISSLGYSIRRHK